MQRAFLMIVLISTVTISASAQGANKQDPTTRLWLELKKELTGPDAQRYFDEAVKDAALPTLVGELASAIPSDRPTILTFLMPGGKDQVTLRIKDARGEYDNFPGPLKLGSRISFEAVAVSFVKQPFMLVLDFKMAQRENYTCDPLRLRQKNIRPLACNFHDKDSDPSN
jgi:tRNA nucleotidyltransferase/poly(A) polymerase